MERITMREIRRRRRRRQVRERRKRIAAVVAVVILVAASIAAVTAAVKSGGKQRETKAELVQQETKMEEGSTMEAAEHPTPEQLQTMEKYGCHDLYGEYEFPWNTMSQDWSGEQLEGFYYHDISDAAKREGGEFPVIAQIYTYIVCRQRGVDYEIVFALIERESRCRWDAVGDGCQSIGLMQIMEKWHGERMERLGCTDMMNPYQNIKVGVDFLAELQRTVPDSEYKMADVLAAYNMGLTGAKRNLWDNGRHWYSYNEEIIQRAEQLKEERRNGKE